MLNTTLKATGVVSIVLTDEFGKIKDKREFPNLITTVGLGFVTSRMAGTASAVMSHMAVGTGDTAPVVGNTTLETELARVALTSTTPSGATVTYAASFGAGVGTGALTEAGILNAASAGTLLARTTFAVINKGASDSLTISWTVTAA